MKKGHVVSWVTSHRVALRTKAVPDLAHTARLQALYAVRDNYTELVASTDPEGWTEGDSGDRAEELLEAFYKPDEAYAFSLHALPPAAPEVMVLQCWIIGGGPPVWSAIRRDGAEITKKEDLPPGVLGLKPRKVKKAGTRKKGQKPAAPAKAQSAQPAPVRPPSVPPKKK